MRESIIIGGKKFPPELFGKLMRVFIEGFSHSSLSVELAFNEIKKYNERIKEICDKNKDNAKFYRLLPFEDQENIKSQIKYMVCYIAYKRGYIQLDIKDPLDVEKNFNSKFTDLIELMPYMAKFENNKFSQNASYPDISELLEIVSKKKVAESDATNMKKDYIHAFSYALSLDTIGIQEIKEINAIVNEHSSNVTERGTYKRVNNTIPGASFIPTDKTLVPTKMLELLYNYSTNWQDPIMPIDYENATADEKHQYWNKICQREAKFHIEFERIHPFEDGNGRTGRIILNAHLLRATMAPVLITGAISKEYKKFIDDYDIDGFAKDISSWSSQVLTSWISELRLFQHIPEDDIGFSSTGGIFRF